MADRIRRRPAPSFRPNRRLSNPEPMGGIPFWPTILMLIAVGAALILGIWTQTCGMGAAC